MKCGCGKPLHYTSMDARDAVDALVALKGEFTIITTPAGSWRVSRHYVALHGIRGADIPALADRYGWERVHDG